MFETMMPSGSGFAYIFGADADDAPVMIQRLSNPIEGGAQIVNVIPTDGGMTYQSVILPLYNAIEAL
jgi:hypothetical protein